MPAVSTSEIEQVFRNEYGRAVAVLVRVLGDIDLAEESVQDAFTVVALRAKAAGVVEAELARLTGRVPGLDARAQREIAQSMRRIADKLLHAPTVRVSRPPGGPMLNEDSMSRR